METYFPSDTKLLCSTKDMVHKQLLYTLSMLWSQSLFDASSAMKAWCFCHLLWRFRASSYDVSCAVSIFSFIHSVS